MSISKSPDRNTFQQQRYLKKLKENPNDKDAQDMINMYEEWRTGDLQKLDDPEWQKNNMEYDLRTTQWILEKVRESRPYAQNLYAAICNNDFQKLDVIPILTNKIWSGSWRYAGGIIADMREEGDYIDWYCSGIRDNIPEMGQSEWNNLNEEQQIRYKEGLAYVSEGVVTDEIREDLKKLGWIILDQNDNF